MAELLPHVKADNLVCIATMVHLSPDPSTMLSCLRPAVQVLEVVLHDPLYKWALTYAKAHRLQRDLGLGE